MTTKLANTIKKHCPSVTALLKITDEDTLKTISWVVINILKNSEEITLNSINESDYSVGVEFSLVGVNSNYKVMDAFLLIEMANYFTKLDAVASSKLTNKEKFFKNPYSWVVVDGDKFARGLHG